MTQARGFVSLAVAALVAASCGSSRSRPAPLEPDAAIVGFMDAVKANDLRTMAELWGSARGPASGYMDDDELTQRLTIMQRFLVHDRYEIIVPQTEPLSAGQRTRVYQVRITRRGCTPSIPFTLVRSGQGWLVQSVDLSQAGSPTRRCSPPSGTPA